MKKTRGFTIIELMIAIAVLAVLLGIGVPSFQETIRVNRIATVTNDLVAALQFARSEAVRRGDEVTVCSSSDQSTCSGTWAAGWVVRTAAGPIRVWPAARAGTAIDVGGPVVFGALGGVGTERCFDITAGDIVRSVAVGRGGRVRSDTVACI